MDDAAAEIRSPEDVTILPGEKVQIRTGLHFRMPTVEHVQMLVPARQMIDRDVMLFDSNRLIDTWDNDELIITLWNTSQEHDCVINAGDVVAKITVILNSHGSYLSAPWYIVVETEIEQWDEETKALIAKEYAPVEESGETSKTGDGDEDEDEDSWTFK